MTVNEINEKQIDLLKQLSDILEQMGRTPELTQDEAGDDILLCPYDDLSERGEEALGCFYFMPPEDEEEYLLHFQTAFTLDDDVPIDAVPMLQAAISKLNFIQPFGSFLLSLDGEVLSYRNEQGIPMMLDEENQTQLMLYYAEIGQEVVNLWGDTLHALIAGDITPKEFSEALNPETAQEPEE